MGWTLSAALCAIFYSLSGAWQKGALREVEPRLIAFGNFAGAVPIFLVLTALEREPFAFAPAFWAPFAAVMALNFVAYQLYIRALKLSPLSLTIPFLAFTPIFMPVTSRLILGPEDVPTGQGLLGIVLVVAGAYLLHARSLRRGALEPLKAIARERGSLLMLLVAFIWSFTANLDKAAIAQSSRDRYFLLVHLGFTLAFGAMLVPVWPRARAELRRSGVRLLVLGLLGGLTLVFQGAALVLTRAPYVIAVKRAGLLLSIAIGTLWFEEGTLAERLPGGALMAAGAAVVMLAR